ncbi:MAG: RnfABCDGE type electron transport complex subunit D [Candidatus Symbiothrix sp.]|jgi:Na+-transporting NADH:ubiquinone oxidoreductase subunit B|nr:RnfABCDGE type electron transport complex subunit D [Candidatus Symbiothrix sp.]
MKKFIRNQLDNLKPTFEPGGKLAMFYSVFEGMDSFLFVSNETGSETGTHIHASNDLKRAITLVIIALIPCVLFGMYNVGYHHFIAIGESAGFISSFFYGLLAVLPMLVVSYGVGLGIEFALAQWKGYKIQEGFWVSGMLIPMILPVETPLWMIGVATAFSVLICKAVFFRTGFNIWTPALITCAFLFFVYPSNAGGPLSYWDMFWGLIPGSVGETSKLCILIGAIILLATGIASWRTMVSVFAGGLLTAWIFNWINASPAMQISPLQHILLGGFAFGAVFMATDPVTSPRTRNGKYVFGFLTGLSAIVIRVLTGYPESMMFAILLMNLFTPLIDYCVVQTNVQQRLKRIKK